MNIGKHRVGKFAACALLAVSMLLASAPLAMAKSPEQGTKTVAKAKTSTAVKKPAKAKKIAKKKGVVTAAAKKKAKKAKSPEQGTKTGSPTKKVSSSTSTSSHKVTKKTVPTGNSGSATIDATQDATQSVVVADAPVHAAKVAKVKKVAAPKPVKVPKAKKPKKVKAPVSPSAVGLPRGNPQGTDPSPAAAVQPSDPSSDWSTDPGLGFTPQAVQTEQPSIVAAAPAQQQVIAATATEPSNINPALGLGSLLGSSFMGILVSVKRILTSM